MRKVSSIGIVLEECETIVFDIAEVKTFSLSSDARDVRIDNDGCIYDYGLLSSVDLAIRPNGNHTYNSFGAPSKDTTFERLMQDKAKITQIQIRCDDGTKTTFVADDALMRLVALDESGGLNVSMNLLDEDGADWMTDDCADEDW